MPSFSCDGAGSHSSQARRNILETRPVERVANVAGLLEHVVDAGVTVPGEEVKRAAAFADEFQKGVEAFEVVAGARPVPR